MVSFAIVFEVFKSLFSRVFLQHKLCDELYNIHSTVSNFSVSDMIEAFPASAETLLFVFSRDAVSMG